MHATDSPELLRIPEVAERLNVSRASVYRWIEEGRLPAVRLGPRGSPLRVCSSELEEWLASHVTLAERRETQVRGSRLSPAVPRFELAHGGRGSA